MQASERLRELDGHLAPPPWDGFPDHLMVTVRAMAPLRDALPLIADVVEAAEETAAHFPPGSYLAERLTALREALGEK